MLKKIHVKNLALIDDTVLEFDKGLNIISGETGAGKSLLIKSVELALGKKGDKSLIRAGADAALCELEFDCMPDSCRQILDDNDIDTSLPITISRKISDNKSVARINGETVNLKLLSQVTSKLIALHGQQSATEFRNEDYHLELLDLYGAADMSAELKDVNDSYEFLVDAENKYKSLLKQSQSPEFSRDFLEFEVNELTQANLVDGELEELESKFKIMNESENILRLISNAYEALSGNNGITDSLSTLSGDFNSYAEFDDTLKEIYDNIASMEAVSYDTIRLLDRYKDSLDLNVELKVEIEARINEINHLITKYGLDVNGLIDLLETKQKILDKLDNFDEYLNNAKQNYEDALIDYNNKALLLSNKRKEIGNEFINKIIVEMQDLDFTKIEMSFDYKERSEPNKLGKDLISIMVSFNSGEPVKPLTEIASGGELSRVMLAVKSALGNRENMPTMIFDEIDTGISGHGAVKVGAKMKDISSTHQILTITHLAQIVALGDNNFVISKETSNNRTTTHVNKMDEEGIINEIARILSGDKITDSILQAARELRTQ